jgi:erythronate-4-phosphate dehydrogenase
MLIVADENIPYASEWFASYGEVEALPGRALNAEQLRDADALLVRSVTQVNRRLLQGTHVRFVGSATSGIEHIDTEYLLTRNIAYAGAPGCNATSVVEYVLSCICSLDGVLEKLLTNGVVGIIGLGNVGARLAQRLQALDICCIGYDPFLQAESFRAENSVSIGDLTLCDFETVLRADVICCHTPLTTTGAYPTRYLLNADHLNQLRQDAVLINAGRGAVIDNSALLNLLRKRDDLRVVLDVWESEPEIDRELLRAVALATPHVAGYSWDGKVAGTRAVLGALCSFFQLPLPATSVTTKQPTLQLLADEKPAALLRSAMQSIYDVRRDDSDMRTALLSCDVNQIAAAFDCLRKNYPQRREVASFVIENWESFNSVSQSLLQRLGFSSQQSFQ